MATTKHVYRGELTIDPGMMQSLEMEVTFSFTPAERATYWEPGCGETAEVESVKAFLLPKNKPRVEVEVPQWMLELICEDKVLNSQLIDHATECLEGEYEAAMDFKFRQQRDDLMTEA